MAVAIAAGVTALIGAGVSAYGQYKAGQTAEAGLAGLSNRLTDFGTAQSNAGKANAFNQDQLQQYLGMALPNYQKKVDIAFKNTASWLRGKIPLDVQGQIKNATAQQAIGGGFAGSRMSANLTARDLGLSSLQLMQQGQNSAQSWIQTAHQYLMPKLMGPQDFMINPAQQAQLGLAGIESQASGQAAAMNTLGQGISTAGSAYTSAMMPQQQMGTPQNPYRPPNWMTQDQYNQTYGRGG